MIQGEKKNNMSIIIIIIIGSLWIALLFIQKHKSYQCKDLVTLSHTK